MGSVETYELIIFDDPYVYMFVTKGDKEILKKVTFEDTALDRIYNVAMGDVNIRTGETDYMARPDHKFPQKMLATVVKIIYTFPNIYPDFGVIIEGNIDAKKRVYQMGLHKYFAQLSKDFEIQGMIGEFGDGDSIIERYNKTQKYDAIIARRKQMS